MLAIDLYLIIDFYFCFLSNILSFDFQSLYFQIRSLIVFYLTLCHSIFVIVELFKMNCSTLHFIIKWHFLVIVDKIFTFLKHLLNLRFLAEYRISHYFHFVLILCCYHSFYIQTCLHQFISIMSGHQNSLTNLHTDFEQNYRYSYHFDSCYNIIDC